MGGFGSGRLGWRQKAENTRSLDVNRLYKAGYLSPGSWGTWQWTRDGEEVGAVQLGGTTGGGLRLKYRVHVAGEGWASVDYTVPLTSAPCTKGGERPYFLCPGVRDGRPCRRRVAKLYSGGQYFLCRHCYGLTYQSRSEAPYERLLRRANKLRQTMGGEPGAASPFPLRPKGQWTKTYEAKLEQIWQIEDQADLHFTLWATQRFPGMLIEDLLG